MVDTNNLYIRQDGLGLVREQQVCIIGCGGVGSWAAYFLALAGIETLLLFDGDKINDHNLNRLPFTPKDVGKYKSAALSELVRNARPDINVSAFGNFEPQFHQVHFESSSAVVVSTDTLKSRRMVFDMVLANRKEWGLGPKTYPRYYELGADGHGCSLSGSPPDWASPLEEEPGYQSVPVHVGPATLAASMASYYVMTQTVLSRTLRFDWQYGEGMKFRDYSDTPEVAPSEVADDILVEDEAEENQG